MTEHDVFRNLDYTGDVTRLDLEKEDVPNDGRLYRPSVHREISPAPFPIEQDERDSEDRRKDCEARHATAAMGSIPVCSQAGA